jgi:hypothetical protein
MSTTDVLMDVAMQHAVGIGKVIKTKVGFRHQTNVISIYRVICAHCEYLDVFSEYYRSLEAIIKLLRNSQPEYYNVGHDNSAPIFDPAILMDPPFKETLASMLGGIGNARHLYTTIIAVTSWEEQFKSALCVPKYHFTYIGLKTKTMARLLVMVLLIHRMPFADTNSVPAQRINSTACYIFVAPIMPLFAYQHLQKTITLAIDMLEGRWALPVWITIYEVGKI